MIKQVGKPRMRWVRVLSLWECSWKGNSAYNTTAEKAYIDCTNAVLSELSSKRYRQELINQHIKSHGI